MEGSICVCSLVKTMPMPNIASKKERCSSCNEEVWISPATIRAIEKDTKIVCEGCAIEMIDDDDELMLPSAEQTGEIKAGLSRTMRN